MSEPDTMASAPRPHPDAARAASELGAWWMVFALFLIYVLAPIKHRSR